MTKGIEMADPKVAVLVGGTMAAASSSWLEIAEPIVTITMTLLVGAVTVWYTIERARQLRRDRLKEEPKDNG